jgi:hypothetical protein
MVGVGTTVYRDGWSLSCSVQRWLELEIKYTEMVGVRAKVNRDSWSWSNDVQRWLELGLKYCTQRWLELELQCIEMVGVGAKVLYKRLFKIELQYTGMVRVVLYRDD